MTTRILMTVFLASLLSLVDAAESTPAVAATVPQAEAKSDKPEAKRTETSKPATNKQAINKPAPKSAANSQLGMSVTGTQEAPKVLYIVPWKTLDAVPAEPYVSGLLDEVFSPVDPVVFERSVHQHEQIQAVATPAAAEK